MSDTGEAEMKSHPEDGDYLSDNADLRDFSTSLNNEALSDSTVSANALSSIPFGQGVCRDTMAFLSDDG